MRLWKSKAGCMIAEALLLICTPSLSPEFRFQRARMRMIAGRWTVDDAVPSISLVESSFI